MKKIKSKKTIIAIVLIAVLAIGGTLAFYTSSATFDNEFVTAEYKTVAEEVFESPTNWKPGDTTPKTITVTNEGDINARVRVCISDSWLAKDGTTTLPNHDETNNIDIAVINPANTSDWTKSGNCYYYNEELEPNETTTSPIESVTFNENYQGDVTCTTVNNTITCESGNTGYDGATYTLTFTAETIQSEGIGEWGIGYYSGLNTDFNTYSNSSDAITASGYDTFLRNELTSDGIVPQVGFRYEGTDYYLTALPTKYEDNKEILDDVLGSSNCEETNDLEEVSGEPGTTYEVLVPTYTCETPTLDVVVTANENDPSVQVRNYKTNGIFTCYSGVGCFETRSGYSATGFDHYETAEEAMASSGHLNYLRYQINGKNVTSSVGFKVGDNLYYLVGGDQGASYELNKATLTTVFGTSNCTETVNGDSKEYICSNDKFKAYASSSIGGVQIKELGTNWNCCVSNREKNCNNNRSFITHTECPNY